LLDMPGIISVIKLDMYSVEGTPDISQMQDDVAEYMRSMINAIDVWRIHYIVDNTPVVAYAAAPKNYTEEKLPLVLYARGGNGNFGALHPFNFITYVHATQCIFIGSNYRYADEFGGADVNDVVFWLDVIPSLGFAEQSEIYMLGESRGGMQTCLTLIRDTKEIIKAAACIGGVYDLIATFNEREDMRNMLINRIGGSPEQCPEEYEKRSAVHFADKINTPILIVHSTGDPRSPYSEAVAFAAELEKHGKTYCFNTREDNMHVIATVKELNDIMDWMKTNKK